jgi:hypothetical protein
MSLNFCAEDAAERANFARMSPFHKPSHSFAQMMVNRQPDQILCSRGSRGNAEFDLEFLRNLEGHGGEASFRPERLRFTFDYRSQQLDVQNCSDRFGNAA